MSARKHVNLLTDPVGPGLIRMAIPMALAMGVMLAYNLADTWFIGMLGTEELAAISFTFPVAFVVSSLAMGMGVGLASVVAPILGRKDHAGAARIVSDGLLLTTLLIVLLSLTGYLTMEVVFTAMGATPVQMALIREYMTIWYIGIGLLVIPMVGNSALRAGGNTRGPSQIMILSAVVNLVLDPLLIFGPGPFPALGMAGAAWATLFSWMITLVAATWMLGKQERLLSRIGFSISRLLANWRRLLVIGLPASFSQMLNPIAAGFITRMVSDYGTDAVAAFGVGVRIEPMAFMLTMALASCLPGFVGQNHGAGNPQRVNEGIRFSLRFTLLVQTGIWFLLLLTGSLIASFFSDSESVQQGIRWYLWLVPLSYGILGWGMVTSNTFNALHKPGKAFVANLLRLFVFTLPSAWIGGQLAGLWGIFCGIAVGNLISGVVAATWLLRTLTLDQPMAGLTITADLSDTAIENG